MSTVLTRPGKNKRTSFLHLGRGTVQQHFEFAPSDHRKSPLDFPQRSTMFRSQERFHPGDLISVKYEHDDNTLRTAQNVLVTTSIGRATLSLIDHSAAHAGCPLISAGLSSVLSTT